MVVCIRVVVDDGVGGGMFVSKKKLAILILMRFYLHFIYLFFFCLFLSFFF